MFLSNTLIYFKTSPQILASGLLLSYPKIELFHLKYWTREVQGQTIRKKCSSGWSWLVLSIVRVTLTHNLQSVPEDTRVPDRCWARGDRGGWELWHHCPEKTPAPKSQGRVLREAQDVLAHLVTHQDKNPWGCLRVWDGPTWISDREFCVTESKIWEAAGKAWEVMALQGEVWRWSQGLWPRLAAGRPPSLWRAPGIGAPWQQGWELWGVESVLDTVSTSVVRTQA